MKVIFRLLMIAVSLWKILLRLAAVQTTEYAVLVMGGGDCNLMVHTTLLTPLHTIHSPAVGHQRPGTLSWSWDFFVLTTPPPPPPPLPVPPLWYCCSSIIVWEIGLKRSGSRSQWISITEAKLQSLPLYPATDIVSWAGLYLVTMTTQSALFILSWAAVVTCRSVGESGLQVEVTRSASCQDSQKAQNGDKVTVHYGGFLQDGKYIILFYLCVENCLPQIIFKIYLNWYISLQRRGRSF